ncbi:hypothetical protein RHGRI_019098 [Rhododendron griersonianum]|uniref:WHIM1 domain-containing protein n=1 Tax=Rhododendron griersonianum TaxID=479676 RepID=A0AAV6JCC2_9ERIC|nr:hypothetical protein RHGRI_019098 [Rhododendron griersonianum]
MHDLEGEGADESPEVHDLDDSFSSFSKVKVSGTLVNQFVDVSGKENGASEPGQGDTEIDESKSGQPWVLGLTEGEYSDLSVEERLRALVAVDRLDAANALKKQMLAEAQLAHQR